jgi:hypothetical protein
MGQQIKIQDRRATPKATALKEKTALDGMPEFTFGATSKVQGKDQDGSVHNIQDQVINDG